MKVSNLDKTNIDAFGNMELIPKGKYDLMITRAEEKIAKKSGNAYILLGLRILNDDPDKSYRGRYVWTNLNNSEIGVKILKSILVFNNSPLAELEGDAEIDPSSLLGMKVAGTVGTEKGPDDEPRNKVGYFKPVDESFANTTEDYFESNVEQLANADSSATNDDLPF